jgi:hypothetical protein
MKGKTNFKLIAIPIFLLVVFSVFVIVNGIGNVPMVTLAFPTTNAPNEDIYFLQYCFVINGTVGYYNTVNLSAPVQVPVGTRLLNMTIEEYQNGNRYSPSFRPFDDAYATFTVIAPNGSTVKISTETPISVQPYNATDYPLSQDSRGYNSSADYYSITWSAIFTDYPFGDTGITLITGTWSINLTTYTQ